MTKSDNTLQEICIEPATNPQRKPNWAGDKTINAFDTETSKGTVFLLSYDIDGLVSHIGNYNGSKVNPTKIIDILTHTKCRSAINVWYNLDFDANAILSDILDKDSLKNLTITNHALTEIDDTIYEITYIKEKFLLIKDDNGHSYKHFDISQFLYTSLENAVSEWLGETKADEDINVKKFKDTEYIENNYQKIVEYAEKDAEITKKLANELITQAEDLGIPMGTPYSTGYLSSEYFRNHMDSKPRFYIQNMQKMFWDAYFGGRFEVFERGLINNIVGADINSAYPAIMSKLPSPSTLRWEKLKDEISMKKLRDSDYGVIKLKVATNHDKKIQPFAKKINGTVKFPILTMHEITTLKDTFLFALDNGYIEDYQIECAWVGFETNETTYPFEFMEPMYGERKLAENRMGELKKGQLLKIILNSGYGKTCQTTPKTEIMTIPESGLDISDEPTKRAIPRYFFSHKQRDILEDNEIAVETLTAGKRFNPFFASYITGLTRLKLLETVEKYNLVEDTIMFATDCIMVRKDAFENSEFSDKLESKDYTGLSNKQYKQQKISDLGGWDFDYKGDAFVIGSGVYQINKNDKCKKMQTRGYPEKQIDGNLLELAKENKNGIPIENTRPLTIAELMRSKEGNEPGNVSEFVTKRKELKPDFDSKRNWNIKNPTFEDLTNDNHTSKPINPLDEQVERMKEIQDTTRIAEKGADIDIMNKIANPQGE